MVKKILKNFSQYFTLLFNSIIENEKLLFHNISWILEPTHYKIQPTNDFGLLLASTYLWIPESESFY